MMMLAALVLLCLVGYSDALSCLRCENVPCPFIALPCKPSEYVYEPCGCCPLCPLEIGQPCGSFTQRCQFGL
nr:perlustrin [Haliotis discus hannai]